MNTKHRTSVVSSIAFFGAALLGLAAGCSGTFEGAREDFHRNGDKLNDAIHGRPREARYTNTYDPYYDYNHGYRYSEPDSPYSDSQ